MLQLKRTVLKSNPTKERFFSFCRYKGQFVRISKKDYCEIFNESNRADCFQTTSSKTHYFHYVNVYH